MFAQLTASGVSFQWKADDGAVTVGTLLNQSYGVIWQQSTAPASGAQTLNKFVGDGATFPGVSTSRPAEGTSTRRT